MDRTHRSPRRATALVVVVGIIAVLAALAVQLHTTSSHRLRLAGTAAQRLAALSLARSGVLLAGEALKMDQRPYFFLPAANPERPVENPGTPSDLEKAYLWFWRSTQAPAPFEGGTLRVDLQDDQARVPLNRASVNLLAGLLQSLGATSTATTEVVGERVVRDRSRELACALVDWRDADGNPEAGLGAETPFYERREPPYRCRNAPFQTVGEAALVRDVTPGLMARDGAPPSPSSLSPVPDLVLDLSSSSSSSSTASADLLTSLTPFGPGAQVNVNTASDAVLCALPGLAAAAAYPQALAEFRRRRPFKTLAEFRDTVSAAVGGPSLNELLGAVTLTSNRFRVVATATSGGAVARVEAVLARRGQLLSVLLWKER